MRLSYFIIPIITIIAALKGSYLTSNGMAWYNTLNLPSIAPPGSFIGIVWTIIFILSTISALIFWQKSPRNKRFKWVTALFLINAFLNVFWSYLFFTQHLILWAIIEMIVLNLTVIVLVLLLWRISKWASILLLPYALWVAFATFLATKVFMLN